MSDIYGPTDTESFQRYGGGCLCGPVYTYMGIPEPGQFDPSCPVHYNAEYMASLEAATPHVCDQWCQHCRQVGEP